MYFVKCYGKRTKTVTISKNQNLKKKQDNKQKTYEQNLITSSHTTKRNIYKTFSVRVLSIKII